MNSFRIPRDTVAEYLEGPRGPSASQIGWRIIGDMKPAERLATLKKQLQGASFSTDSEHQKEFNTTLCQMLAANALASISNAWDQEIDANEGIWADFHPAENPMVEIEQHGTMLLGALHCGRLVYIGTERSLQAAQTIFDVYTYVQKKTERRTMKPKYPVHLPTRTQFLEAFLNGCYNNRIPLKGRKLNSAEEAIKTAKIVVSAEKELDLLRVEAAKESLSKIINVTPKIRAALNTFMEENGLSTPAS